MIDTAILWEWLSFAVRWAHVVAGIAWIGTSFYFIALDLGLRRDGPLASGVGGEEWQVHGGGFYHVQKYTVAPAALPEHLIWFKWESYATWLTGMLMLVVVYYAQAELYLIDREVMDLSPTMAILVSLTSLAIGWVLYNGLCRSPLGRNDLTLMAALFVLLVAMAWGYAQLFSGRAAFLHLGAFTGTIMSANVAMVIMPNQRKAVAALLAGRSPEPRLGREAKQRSLHNNYLTLPVIFLMLSNHYPLAFASAYNWLIASLVFLMGVTIRHYFNTYYAKKGVLIWPWVATVAIFAVIVWLSALAPPGSQASPVAGADQPIAAHARSFASHPRFGDVVETVTTRCAMCHAREPVWAGIATAPKGLRLETAADVAGAARDIYLHAGASRAMPPGNLSALSDADRALIRAWYREGSRPRG